MLKKTVTWVDFDGNERTEDFWFHFSKAECLEMKLSTVGGFDTYLQRIINAKDTPSLIKEFKDIVLKAYGKKSDDGRNFIKSDELRKDFQETEAYSIIFMELATDADAAQAFINGILPTFPEDHKPAEK